MATRDHDPLVITQFRGTFDRGEDDTVPPGFFVDSLNVQFQTRGVRTRYGTSESIEIGSVKRQAVYKRIGEAQRLLILVDGGDLYDSTDLSAPILTIPAMTDFSMVSLFNRAYITPHNGTTGLPGEKVYVYDGSGPGTARAAGGVGPSDTLTLTDTGASGIVEAGFRVVGVAFETNTGFITAPGGFASITTAGGKQLRVANIEIGGSQVVARHIVVSRIIPEAALLAMGGTFNGDFQSQTYYFAHRIDDNTTTSVDINFYDSQLVRDASYLLEEVSEIPAGVGIGVYRAKLIVWGEDANSAVCRVSRAGEPESFNEIEGFFLANPGLGGGIKNCWEYRTQLFIQKSQHTFVTQDNGNEAAFWEVTLIDSSVGTECHGVAKSLDFGEAIRDHVFVGDRAGLKLFNGTFNVADLTYNISDIWARINKTAFHTIEIVVDPLEEHIYAAVPLDDATSPNAVLFGDYSEGLTPEFIKWTTWRFPTNPTTISVVVVNGVTVFKYGSIDDNVYDIDPSATLDDNLAIESYIEFPFFPVGEMDDLIYHYTGVRLRVRGSGILTLRVSSLDRVRTLNAQSLTLSTAPGKPLFGGYNFTSEKAALRLRMNLTNEWFLLTKAIFYMVPVWEDRGA
jgi:hypothetical protein